MNYIEKQDLIAARKSRNQMHRRAQLAEAKLKATYKLLEAEGAYHLDAPVVVQKDGDIVRLLSTINFERFQDGFDRGKKYGTPSLRRAIFTALARKVSDLYLKLTRLAK